MLRYNITFQPVSAATDTNTTIEELLGLKQRYITMISEGRVLLSDSKMWSWALGTWKQESLRWVGPAAVYQSVSQLSESKIWSRVLWDSVPRLTVLMRISSNLPVGQLKVSCRHEAFQSRL
jgi:hypothetical protein